MPAAEPAVEVAEVRWTAGRPDARSALLALLFAPNPGSPATCDPLPRTSASPARGSGRGKP